MFRLRFGWMPALALSATSLTAQRSLPPVLNYDPPANFYRSAIATPEQYFSTTVNASLQVYNFRPFAGDMLSTLQRTLLRDWIDPQYQETTLSARPMFGRDTVPGAQAVFTVRFQENIAGRPKERMRIVIVAGGGAAVVDVQANDIVSWQQAGPAIRATLASLRVGSVSSGVAEPPAVSGPIDAAIAGYYTTIAQNYKVNLLGPVGSGSWVPAVHYYLLSPDGRVYRGYDMPSAPGGDIKRFDYDAAQRADPENSGRYSVQGDRLVIRLGNRQAETITTTLPKDDRMLINTRTYTRQVP